MALKLVVVREKRVSRRVVAMRRDRCRVGKEGRRERGVGGVVLGRRRRDEMSVLGVGLWLVVEGDLVSSLDLDLDLEGLAVMVGSAVDSESAGAEVESMLSVAMGMYSAASISGRDFVV